MRTTLRFNSARAARCRGTAWLLALLAANLGTVCACAPVRDLASSSYAWSAQRNPADPAREAAPYGIEAVCARGTLNYLIPTDGGVVLVDAGYDENGAAILDALGGRPVLAVLLTHGHIDHRAAAHLFDAPVYVGRGDVPSFVDDRYFKAVAPLAGEIFLGTPPAPRDLRSVDDEDVIKIGGKTFTAIHLPGHTPGSTAWLVGDVLFTGDAVQSPHGDAVYPAPWSVSENVKQAWRSLRRLEAIPFRTLFDGHYGRLDDAKPKVRAALETFKREGALVHPLFRPTACAERAAVHSTPHAHP